jgi:superfamily I DNA and RNA helicase
VQKVVTGMQLWAQRNHSKNEKSNTHEEVKKQKRVVVRPKARKNKKGTDTISDCASSIINEEEHSQFTSEDLNDTISEHSNSKYKDDQ